MATKQQRIHLPNPIRKARDSWNDIAKALPGPLRHKRGWLIEQPEMLFAAMLLVLWRNQPLRRSLGKPYKSGDTLQKHLIEWAFRGDLQRLWRAYLDVLDRDEIKAWVYKFEKTSDGPFKSRGGGASPPESRKYAFWFMDLSRILVDEAKKVRLRNTNIRLPEKA